MKKTTLVASLILISLGLNSQPQHAPTQRGEAVFAWADQDHIRIDDARGSTTYYNGAKIYCSSSSSNAPVFPQASTGAVIATNLVSLGEATAILLSQGYTVKVSDNGLFVYATKL